MTRAATAAVVTLAAALLRDRDAARYIGRSPSWLRARRAVRVKALREGREPPGPAHIVIDKSVFYRRESLDAWIEENAVPDGVVPFANRGT